jgi:hypothetical protein
MDAAAPNPPAAAPARTPSASLVPSGGVFERLEVEQALDIERIPVGPGARRPWRVFA